MSPGDRILLPEPLLRALPGDWPDEDLRLVERAYHVAAYWHRGQTRRSGDPYITHPVEVAAILAGVGVDRDMVCAALLHDVIDDTRCTPEELHAEFGDAVGGLVHGVTDPVRPEVLEEDLSPADVRVLTIKLADRLHNMRTVRFVAQDKQRRKSDETLRVFAPLAARLGLGDMGEELRRIARTTLRARLAREPRLSLRLVSAAAVLLPAPVRARWVEEWRGELHTLPARGRTRFAGQLLCGMPRLAVTLRRSGDGPSFAVALLRWVLASNVRTWGLLLPFVAWMVIETGRENPGDAVASLITVPPVLVAGVERLRGHLGVSREKGRRRR